jgi:peptide chain release factor 1
MSRLQRRREVGEAKVSQVFYGSEKANLSHHANIGHPDYSKLRTSQPNYFFLKFEFRNLNFPFHVDYTLLISKRKERFAALEEAVGDPDLFSDPKRATEILREHRKLKQTLDLWETLRSTESQLEDNRELAKGDDKEFAAMAAEEIPELEKSVEKLRDDLQYALLPADPNEDRDALVEIRAGAGGDEASLFAGEMMRAYQRYADAKGWKSEHLESSPSEVGGFKEVILKISGDEVFRHLKYESGVHRVQRVPSTETQGRIHTSTITVAVLPEAEEIDVDMNPNDLRIEVCRSGGAGGQHVNTTDSAVQIFHLPTGLYVRCEHGRSQTKNKEMALQIMRSRLYEKKMQEQQAAYSENRRSLIGSGDRSEKIRTYNFPQSRCTDHRIGFTSHNLDAIMSGDLTEVTAGLMKHEMAERLAEAGM